MLCAEVLAIGDELLSGETVDTNSSYLDAQLESWVAEVLESSPDEVARYRGGEQRLLGFLMGTLLGIVLATGIVHVASLDKSLMPWVVASQTIPVLAIAPMIIVVLASVGLTGLIPKAIISTFLSFFPVTVGMVKGLRAPDPINFDLMRTPVEGAKG